ncbi:MAG: protein-disulfide reductase DsbD [Melioribacteraceae bacterium]|nr:protein-disulfide reductase DsbD [Melioribacteraceae bacterium]
MKKRLIIIYLLMVNIILFGQFGGNANKVSVQLIPVQDIAVQGSQFNVIIKANIEDTWHINSHTPNDDFLIASTIVSDDPRFPFAKVIFPTPKDLDFEFSDNPVSVFEGTIRIGISINIDENMPVGNYKIPITLRYQACNDQTCLPPTNITDTLNLNINEKSASAKSINEEEAEGIDFSSISVDKTEDGVASMLESSGLLLGLIFVFLGGLALNLTPCVYPLIPITIGYFGGQSEGRTSRLFVLGILYVLGMALTYSIIGVITALSGAIFGALLQNPFVIVGIALLFIILALSQFGVYEFKLPDSWVMKAGGAKSGIFGAFFMGLTMGVVAAPCIGPFVLGLVTYVAAKGDPLFGFLMFFTMALGLGLPYLILALFSGKIKNLPRAGLWMEGVKHIFGFLLIGMAIYFIAPIMPKVFAEYSLPVFGIIAALILLFYDKKGNNITSFKIFKIIFSVIVIIISIWSIIPQEKVSPDWKEFSYEKYQSSINANERMIIDFYADWCIPCKELDALTFSDLSVVEESKRFTAYKVDMTQTLSDETEELRNKFNIIGMPTVLIIDSEGNEIHRLTGFVNAEEFLKLLKEIK